MIAIWMEGYADNATRSETTDRVWVFSLSKPVSQNGM